jgi:hypothetical protein
MLRRQLVVLRVCETIGATFNFCDVSLASWIHMRCRMTARLRATATLALRSPLRLASPQAYSPGLHGGPFRGASRLLQTGNSHGFAALRDATCPIDLSGRMTSTGQPNAPNCLVPECGGISQTDPSIREALWDRYSTAAPRPRTRSELQYSDRKLRSKS